MSLNVRWLIWCTGATMGVVTAGTAQTEIGFDADRLHPVSALIGGVWGAQEVQTDGDGRSFVPIKSYRWTADGAAIAVRLDYLFADGAVRPGITGLTVWDPAAETLRAFGVFSHGGIISDATYRPETLRGDTTTMDFRFVAPSGDVSQWKSVEIHLDHRTHREEGYVVRDGTWQRMSQLTYHRLQRIDGQGTYRDLVRRR